MWSLRNDSGGSGGTGGVGNAAEGTATLATVRVATTTNIANLATGAPDTVDGVALALNDFVLVKDQTTGSQNGIYQVASVGTGADGVWARASSYDEDADLEALALILVQEGTLGAGSWSHTTPHPITVDTTALTFSTEAAKFMWHKDWPVGAAQADTGIQYLLWFPVEVDVSAIRVYMATVNTQGDYSLTVANEGTTNTMLSAASFDMDTLVAGTVTSLSLTGTSADLRLPAGTVMTLTLTSDNAGFDGTGTYIEVDATATISGGGGGSDINAIHDNVSGEIAAVTEKASPVSADLVIVEDSAAGNVKKKVQLGNIPGANGTFSDSIVLPKTSGVGVKRDTASPAFGWKDIISRITVRGSGSNDPNFSAYIGNIRQYEWPAAGGAALRESFHEFHMPHDYVPGTDIFIHAHWSCAAGATGDVKWYFEATFARGFDQAAFVAPITTSVVQTGSATPYQHMVAEVQLSQSGGGAGFLDTDALEVAGILFCRLYRDRTDVSDTIDQSVFLHFVDIHYQSMAAGTTKNKAPDFYT